MNWDIVNVTVSSNLTLKIKFSDGTVGRAIFKIEDLTGVFEPLKDPNFFAKAFIDHGVITWPGEIDIAPDAMYQEIKKTGEWVFK